MRKSLSRRRPGEYYSNWRNTVLATNLLAISVFPAVVSADVTGEASARVQYESNSNVLNRQDTSFGPGTDNLRRSDTYISEGATFGLHDFVGRQDLFLTASVTKFQYDHLTELDNTGYTFDGGMNWELNRILNGNIEVGRTRAMTPFLDTSSSTLSQTTDQRESAGARLKIASNWRLDGTGSTHTSEQSQAVGPETRLSEQSGTVALNYLGFGNFTSGVDAGYLSGKYTGGGPTNLQPSYHQITFDLLGAYKASGRSSFTGSVGYSTRESASGANSTSGTTGDISFLDQLTPKTSFSVDVRRAINSYLTNAGSEIDTSAAVGATWLATFKLDVHLGYTYMYREFPNQTPAGYPVGTKLEEAQQAVTLDLNYHPTRWLDIRVYGNVLTRDANAAEDKFNATIYGISFVVRTPKPPGRK